MKKELESYANKIKEAGLGREWVLDLYVGMEQLSWLENIVSQLDIKVCIDHFGITELGDAYVAGKKEPYVLPGFKSLIELLKQRDTYVKMSAAYRIVKEKDMDALTPVAKEILKVAGRTRVVFATDWPHTRFDGLDIRPFVETVVRWCGNDAELVERVFRGNVGEVVGGGEGVM